MKSKPEKNMKKYLMKIGILSSVVFIALFSFQKNYRIGIETQKEKCIPGKTFYVLELNRDKGVIRNEVYEFLSERMEPFFKNGTKVVKVARGLPGDTVKVTYDGTFINGTKIIGGVRYLANYLEKKMPNKKTEDYFRTFTIPENEYFFLGLTDISYDGRYWGTVRDDQIIGRAHGIF